MKVLVDTNVVLDVLLERHPFYDDSFMIFQFVNLKRISACLSATTMTTIFYVLRKARNNADEVYRLMDKLTALFSVAPVSEKTIADALALRWKDFEDAVQCMAATENGADYIVTRNTQDFNPSLRRVSDDVNRMAPRSGDNSSSNIPAVTPEQFMRIIADIEQ